MIAGKHVLVLAASVTTGFTVQGAVEAIRYYGAIPSVSRRSLRRSRSAQATPWPASLTPTTFPTTKPTTPTAARGAGRARKLMRLSTASATRACKFSDDFAPSKEGAFCRFAVLTLRAGSFIMGRLIFLGGIGLNTENLNGILAQYVQHCKARAAADEGTVWRAVDCFGVNWDIEDSDFPAMFADAMQQAQPTLDNPALQPIGGLQNLMLRDSEVEFVRECFRWLYNEDGGDISKRRGRAELFADQINGRFRRVFPRMSKYTMNTANAVFFLNLWEPHANYFYQPARRRRGRITLGMRQTLAAVRRWTCRATTRCATTCCTRWRTTRRSSLCTSLRGAGAGRHRRRAAPACVRHPAHGLRRAVLSEGLHPRLDEQGARKRL